MYEGMESKLVSDVSALKASHKRLEIDVSEIKKDVKKLMVEHYERRGLLKAGLFLVTTVGALGGVVGTLLTKYLKGN